RDDGLRQAPDCRQCGVIDLVKLLPDVGHPVVGRVKARLEVRSGGEPAARAGHEHRSDRFLRGLVLDELLELAAELRRPGVQRVRPVQRQPSQSVRLLPDHGLVAQLVLLSETAKLMIRARRRSERNGERRMRTSAAKGARIAPSTTTTALTAPKINAPMPIAPTAILLAADLSTPTRGRRWGCVSCGGSPQ